MLGIKENDKSFEINNFYVIFFVIIFFEMRGGYDQSTNMPAFTDERVQPCRFA